MSFSMIINRLFYLPEKRNLSLSHFKDKNTRDFYAQHGYAVVRNVVSDEAIKIIGDTYREVYERPEFYEAGGFITTPNYGENIQQTVVKRLEKANGIILPQLFDMQQCEHDFFSLLVMKFNKDGTYVDPHQDISMVDEQYASTTFLWVPTTDIHEHNGALLVLPGSHLWGGWQKTHNRDITPLKKNSQWLLDHMIPVYLKKGDLVLFDASLIHASLPNTSDPVRVAMNTSVIPKGVQMVHYEVNPGTPKGMVEKYHIDKQFWSDMDYLKPLSGKKKPIAVEPLKCSSQLSKPNLKYLLNKYS